MRLVAQLNMFWKVSECVKNTYFFYIAFDKFYPSFIEQKQCTLKYQNKQC